MLTLLVPEADCSEAALSEVVLEGGAAGASVFSGVSFEFFLLLFRDMARVNMGGSSRFAKDFFLETRP
ncbi:MAG: hypothetical protein AB7T14_09620 [Candidatus Methylacidiphilaceae bacterium]